MHSEKPAGNDARVTDALRLLVTASRELSASFDCVQTLAAVAGLVVPRFADGFSVVLGSGGERRMLVTAGSESGGADSYPLLVRGQLLGTMCVEGGRDLSDGDVSLWDDLALRIATAVDSAEIYAREHHVADTLQRALLPDRLPLDDRLLFDAAYRPGAEEAIVGGDWYDAFRLSDGRIAFSVGDVAGHGLRAAVVMGEVRQAFRAAALNPKSPSMVLERANAIVNMRTNPVMVTAAFGIIDPTDGTLVYASAGHPPPLFALPGGIAALLPTDGLPLGIVDRVDAHDWTFTLPPGGALALYTDGMIEYERDALAGETALIEASPAIVVAGDTQPAKSLANQIFREIGNTDDAAVLVVRTADVPGRSLTFCFSAVPMAVPLVRASLRRYAAGLNLDTDAVFGLLTAAGEALANAVEHAYSGFPGIVRLNAFIEETNLVVTVEDEGRWKPQKRKDERGRGMPIMRALMDSVEIQSDVSRTLVRLTLHLDGRCTSAATA